MGHLPKGIVCALSLEIHKKSEGKREKESKKQCAAPLSPLSMAGDALFLLIDIRENSSVKRSFSKAARIDKVQPAQSKRACLHPVGSAALTRASRPRGLGGTRGRGTS